jgi:hypothetical protein
MATHASTVGIRSASTPIARLRPVAPTVRPPNLTLVDLLTQPAPLDAADWDRINDLAGRSYEVEFRRSYLPDQLHWRLRCYGQSVGGYGVLNGTNPSSYHTEAAAEAAGTEWVRTGVTPAHQGEKA